MKQSAADLIYADDYNADGRSAYDYPPIKEAGSPTFPINTSTYQPRYDSIPFVLFPLQ